MDLAWPPYIELPCGATADFDDSSGYGYRCTDCFAVVGSVGMPKACAKLYAEQQDADKIVNKLKGCKYDSH